MVARTRPATFRVLAAWEPSAPAGGETIKPVPVSRPLPPVLPSESLPPDTLAESAPDRPAQSTPLPSPAPTPSSQPLSSAPVTQGLYDLPGLLARILSAADALRTVGGMHRSAEEPRAPPSPPATPGPSLATLAAGESILSEDQPRSAGPPASPAALLAALPVYHWRDWHLREGPSSPGLAPPPAVEGPDPRSAARTFRIPSLVDGLPTQASTCKCPRCHLVDPLASFRGTLARQRHLRFEYSSGGAFAPPRSATPTEELMPAARLARDRWRIYRD